jgi:hypothetical protein
MTWEKIVEHYRNSFLRNDFILSFFLAAFVLYGDDLISSLGLSISWINIDPDVDIHIVISTLIGVEAEFTSIFIASLAIVAAFVDNKRLDRIRETEWFPDIWRFLSYAAILFVIGILLGFAMLLFNLNPFLLLPFITVSILLFIEVYRCARLLALLISQINKEIIEGK